MGQSKLPAKCCECKSEGPSRPLALKGGWARQRLGWFCPACLIKQEEARNKARAAMKAEKDAALSESPRNDRRARNAMSILLAMSMIGTPPLGR